ncbi:MAG: hypothetical protein DRO52_00150 [Candidatus Hecatellales archaeon]|nr:MAG: hypothetical protein DRO52_00150 [Candidatus Hecatellales archaeon]
MLAVVLAAGGGVRLQPLTLTRPKCLLPVGGKPILERIFEALGEAGLKRVLTILSPEGLEVRKLYGEGGRLGLKLSYGLDRKPKGTGSSLLVAEASTGREAFLTIYGDLYLSRGVLKAFLEEALKQIGGCSTVLAAVEVDNPSEYGIVEARGNKVLRVMEKPERAKSNLANAGIYLFKPKVYKALRKVKPSKRGEIELTEALNLLAEEDEVRMVKLPREGWLDVGRPWDLLEANRRALVEAEGRVEGLVEANVTLKGKVIVEGGAVIHAGSVVEGPAFIGSGCEVGPSARIRPYTSLGRNTRVGSFCEVKNSIVMDGSKISHLCYVGDSIIGENCNFGAGTLIANLRLDEKPVKVELKGVRVNSGLRKLGAIIGDNVKTAVNVSIMPGVKIGPGSLIGPNLFIATDIPPNTMVLGRQTLTFKPLGEEA